MQTLTLLAADFEYQGEISAGMGAGMLLFMLVMYTVVPALMWWKVFQKAGKPGWASIVPIYNVWVLLEIGGKPGWWIFVPVANIVMLILAMITIAERFGQSSAYAIGLILLGIVFFPMLGFGDARYSAPGAPPAAA